MIFLSIRKHNHIRLRMCNCQLRWQWWAQVESNHRPHAYQACALTFWAMSPFVIATTGISPLVFASSLWTTSVFSTDGGDEGIRTLDPLLAGQVLSQLSYTPILRFVYNRFSLEKCQSKLVLIVGPWKSNNNFEFANRVFVVCFVSLWVTKDHTSISHVLHRKEVIQPHLPIRLPCYDLTPIIEPTFGRSLLAVRTRTSGVPDFHGLTGGVYKARERIHRGMLIRDY